MVGSGAVLSPGVWTQGVLRLASIRLLIGFYSGNVRKGMEPVRGGSRAAPPGPAGCASAHSEAAPGEFWCLHTSPIGRGFN